LSVFVEFLVSRFLPKIKKTIESRKATSLSGWIGSTIRWKGEPPRSQHHHGARRRI